MPKLNAHQKLFCKKRTLYELSDHLGNVRASIYDIKFFDGDKYLPEFQSSTDYYPFGYAINDRSSIKDSIRDNTFGFNGKLRDDNFSAVVNYDYGFRIYNPGIARFLSVDPLKGSYPWYTPYQFAGNKPIANIDLDGLEEWVRFRVHLVNMLMPLMLRFGIHLLPQAKLIQPVCNYSMRIITIDKEWLMIHYLDMLNTE